MSLVLSLDCLGRNCIWTIKRTFYVRLQTSVFNQLQRIYHQFISVFVLGVLDKMCRCNLLQRTHDNSNLTLGSEKEERWMEMEKAIYRRAMA